MRNPAMIRSDAVQLLESVPGGLGASAIVKALDKYYGDREERPSLNSISNTIARLDRDVSEQVKRHKVGSARVIFRLSKFEGEPLDLEGLPAKKSRPRKVKPEAVPTQDTERDEVQKDVEGSVPAEVVEQDPVSDKEKITKVLKQPKEHSDSALNLLRKNQRTILGEPSGTGMLKLPAPLLEWMEEGRIETLRKVLNISFSKAEERYIVAGDSETKNLYRLGEAVNQFLNSADRVKFLYNTLMGEIEITEGDETEGDDPKVGHAETENSELIVDKDNTEE